MSLKCLLNCTPAPLLAALRLPGQPVPLDPRHHARRLRHLRRRQRHLLDALPLPLRRALLPPPRLQVHGRHIHR